MSRRALVLFLALLAAAGTGACLALALFGHRDLLLVAMKDDGFYYLTLARNIAAGRGATFDGLGPTNGFHPLWTMILTPLFWVPAASLYTPVRLMLVLSVALHVAAAWAVARAAESITSRFAARVAGLFYLANPIGLYLVVSGMEAPLVGLLVALLAGESIRLRAGTSTLARPVAWARLGLLCGLTILARTDTVMLVGLVLAGAAFVPPLSRSSADGGAVGSPFLRFRGAVAAGAMATLVIAPWILWNLVRFGTIVQVSARSHRLHSLLNRAPDGPAGVEGAARTSLSLGEALLRQLAARTHLPQSVALALLAVAAATAAVWLAGLLRPRAARAAILTRLRCLDAPVVYAVGILLATFVILRHIRSWYISGPLVVGALVLAILLEAGWGEIRGSRGTRPLSRLLVGTIVFAHAVLFPAYVNEIVMSARVPFVWREAAAWVDAHTVEGDRVASFNSGSFGYLSPRPVVNLDCVVNNPGMEALEQRRLLAFLEERGVRYLLDDPFYVNRYMNAYAGGDWKAAVVPVETLRERMRVYAVHPIAQTP